ncbi:MAG: Gfo/Idh/MocA family oxidoreductase, partial [Planctomycetota bacterium]|nr:Gfo/Idh/MocA family oxidoreductase [Planctomycetota bacterium]
MADRRLGIGLYGFNGHQIHHACLNHPRLFLAGIAGAEETEIPAALRDRKIKRYPSLEVMLQDPEVEMVSLCSPRRREQANHAIACLRAGKHVYAEKPCAMSEADLDAILAAAAAAGRRFHEMAGTAFEEPYLAMREIVASGCLGEIIQVFAQKSYPYHDGRPQDEDIDG